MKVYLALLLCLGAVSHSSKRGAIPSTWPSASAQSVIPIHPQASSVVPANPFDPKDVNVFDHLDDYSFMGVLDFLPLSDLVIIASMSPRNNQLIVHHYLIPEMGQRDPMLRVSISESESFAFYSRGGMDSSYSELCMGRGCMLAALKVLCPISSELDIRVDYNRRFDAALTEMVESYVGNYCAGTDQHVSLNGIAQSVGQFRFPYAKSVRISQPEAFKHFDLAGSFPRVQQLTINLHGRYSLAQHLPHLTSFRLHDYSLEDFDLQAFGEKNPQIRDADLQICGRIENIDKVNRLFPRLESLQLRLGRPQMRSSHSASADGSSLGPSDSVGLVRFRNVKNFTLDLTKFYDIPVTASHLNADKLSSIAFDRLESFKYATAVVTRDTSDQIDYIARYKDVKRLDISTILPDFEESQRLIDSLPELEEITMACGTSDPTDLIRLMTGTRLQVIRLIARGGFPIATLLERTALPEKWLLDSDEKFVGPSSLTFKRMVSLS